MSMDNQYIKNSVTLESSYMYVYPQVQAVHFLLQVFMMSKVWNLLVKKAFQKFLRFHHLFGVSLAKIWLPLL